MLLPSTAASTLVFGSAGFVALPCPRVHILQVAVHSFTMVGFHTIMQGALRDPDWYINTAAVRPPPLFPVPVFGLYAAAGALLVDLLLGSVPVHLPYAWLSMGAASLYSLAVSVARHGKVEPAGGPPRLTVGWSGIVVTLAVGAGTVVVWAAHRVVHVGIKGRLETVRLRRQRAELQARIAAAEAEAAAEAAEAAASSADAGEGGGAGRGGHKELRRRRLQTAALLDTMDKDDILEADD